MTSLSVGSLPIAGAANTSYQRLDKILGLTIDKSVTYFYFFSFSFFVLQLYKFTLAHGLYQMGPLTSCSSLILFVVQTSVSPINVSDLRRDYMIRPY